MTALPDPLAYQDEIKLTEDERIVLHLIARGDTLRNIETRLDCSFRTAQRHRASILRKLDARNEAHAVFQAFDQGVLAVG